IKLTRIASNRVPRSASVTVRRQFKTMPRRWMRILLAASAMLAYASAADFKLGPMLKPRKGARAATERLTPHQTTEVGPPLIALDIVVNGTPPDETALRDPAHWSVSATAATVPHPIA